MIKKPKKAQQNNIELIVFVSSFGGFETNHFILSHFPDSFSPAIVLLTHLSKNSEITYAQILGHKTGHLIHIAQEKKLIQSGQIYLAPGGYHLLIEDNKTFALSEDKKVHNVRPSADVFLHSLAYTYKENVVAVILTGANEDGASGLKSIYDQGGSCLIQSPESAIADSMPRAAIKACANGIVLPLIKIPETLINKIATG
jgi:two-component system, chemotaxis family, protein-glutamate methylesterase/glutaminase